MITLFQIVLLVIAAMAIAGAYRLHEAGAL
jgi:hypothetical protein